jgi:alkylated DNA repair dioxygenase AlkB
MKNLFESNPIILNIPNGEVCYFPNFYSKELADEIFVALLKETSWQQDEITVYGKKHKQPRLTALYGNEGKSYSYSNIKMQPHLWTPLLQKIKVNIESEVQTYFTTVLLNLYRDGQDSNGWHADNEKELGTNPIIASLSFGAERSFHLKHNTLKDQKIKLILEHGSLLIMKGTTQHFWKHQIPKTTKPISERINLTFRVLK